MLTDFYLNLVKGIDDVCPRVQMWNKTVPSSMTHQSESQDDFHLSCKNSLNSKHGKHLQGLVLTRIKVAASRDFFPCMQTAV